MRPVATKWETSRKISFESYKEIYDVQTLSFSIDFWNVEWAISP